MVKKSLKIIGTLGLIALSQPINEGYSPHLKKISETNNHETYRRAAEKKLETLNYNLNNINEDIISLERKREFFYRRLNENPSKDSLKNIYQKHFNQTNQELAKYYAKKDSLYKIIQKNSLP